MIAHRGRRIVGLRALAVLAVLAWGGCGPREGSGGVAVRVAVAANFAATAEGLARDFEVARGVPVRIAVGSTGSLYAQVVNGAPYDVFLAGDEERPRRLEEAGLAVEGSRFVYAAGRLVVYAPGRNDPWTIPALLREPGIRVAWADPRTAPYGAAARTALEGWGLGELEGAVGESVGHAFQFVRSGAVDAAFVSLAQVRDAPSAHVRVVDAASAPPIPQSAVLLSGARDREAARAFLEFLREPVVRARIKAAGYDLAEGGSGGR